MPRSSKTSKVEEGGPLNRKASGMVAVDGGTVELFYKDWGKFGDPILVFHHGWPLTSDDWEPQMMFFLKKGYRVIAFDRRGHGRSTQTCEGNEYDRYAEDVHELVTALGLGKGVTHIGHSAGGGEVARYVNIYGEEDGVARAVLVSSVPPLMQWSKDNKDGMDKKRFDDFVKETDTNRTKFYWTTPITFYGFNRGNPDQDEVESVRHNWWRQGMMGGVKALSDNVKAWSATDFTQDLKGMNCPVLILQGSDDQIVPWKNASQKQAELIPNNTFKLYNDYPHGMLTIYPDIINHDIDTWMNTGQVGNVDAMKDYPKTKTAYASSEYSTVPQTPFSTEEQSLRGKRMVGSSRIRRTTQQ